MTVDLDAARDFMTTSARVLDRRRFALRFDGGDPAAVLAALAGYRNPDGGYGWGLEPDLRSVESQPVAAMHAFEVLAEVPDEAVTRELCDWLAEASFPDGGVPFARRAARPAGNAPWFADSDGSVSSLQITAAVTQAAHRVPAAAGHPWLAAADAYCRAAIEAIDGRPPALILAFALGWADAVGDEKLLADLGEHVPADGRIPVEGGTADEALHPIDLAPFPGRGVRALFPAAAIEADLDRLTAGQRDDGGWTVEFAKISPAGVLDWRGYQTVKVLDILDRNGRL